MSYRFLRYIRTGAAAAITQAEGAPNVLPRPAFNVGAEVHRDGAVWQTFRPVLRLFGPGDVVGLDPDQVVRSVPDPGAVAADPGDFPFLELARPDMPWLFTPYSPTAADTLTPWLCLVVVETGSGDAVFPGPFGPVLSIDSPARLAELPNLAHAHAWAHVQLDQATPNDDIAALLATHPERFRSRLVAARRLEGARRYVACLVPTFEGGRRSGLGDPVEAASALNPAWTSTSATPFQVPVFHHWEFTSTDAPSFEALARQLTPRADLGDRVGTRTLEVTNPAAATLDLDGAMRIVGTAHAAPPAILATGILERLEQANAVSPPRYGRWHAAAPPIGQPGAPPWLDELNADPVRRVAAAMGTRVVQEHQEELMAAAWEQAGEVLRANQLLRAATLALAAAGPLHTKRFLPLIDGLSALLVTAPAATRLRFDSFTTVRGAVRRSCLPAHVLSGAFRRITRPGGPIARRLQAASDVTLRPGQLVFRLSTGELADVPPPIGTGAVSVSAAALTGISSGSLDSRLQPILETALTLARRSTRPGCTPLDLDAVRQVLREQTDPRRTIPARIAARLDLPPGVSAPVAGVGQVLVAPHIPTPMYRPLVEFSPDWLLPGLGAIPRETLAIVEPNRAFIESYMAGLNHEMGRELLWRGFPTDQRGTVFDHFWDGPRADISALHTWNSKLGSHPGTGQPAVTVIVIRGELVRRFPTATIFLQKARKTATGRTPATVIGGPDTELPIFGGRVGPDIRFVGFAITSEVARGGTPQTGEGYYVTFQQEPGALSFGPVFGGPAGSHAPPAGAADATAAAFVRQPFRLFVHADDMLP